MLGILFIYFIGKYFFDLAKKYNKSKWGFAIGGVATYYIGTFFAGLVLAVYYDIWGSTSMEELGDLTINLICLPFGILICYGFYKLLENNWKNKTRHNNPNVLDAEIIE